MPINKTRWARIGDTVSTVRSVVSGVKAGKALHSIVVEKNCPEANALIERGTWYVSRCGRCEESIELCQCESSRE